MSPNRISRVAAVLVAGATVVLAGAASAAARPDDTDVVSHSPRQVVALPLERIGDQFVRGDNLTGAGAPAPSFVPEVGG